jgi:WD40 repeat protein
MKTASMQKLLLSLALLATAPPLLAQVVAQPCPPKNCACMLAKAENASSRQDFAAAINLYFAAKACDAKLGAEVERRMVAMFERIDSLRVAAAVNERRAAELAALEKRNSRQLKAALQESERQTRRAKSLFHNNIAERALFERDPAKALQHMRYAMAYDPGNPAWLKNLLALTPGMAIEEASLPLAPLPAKVFYHHGPVYGVTALPDGERFLTWSADSTARLWSVSGAELARFRHDDAVFGAMLLPDQDRLLTWSTDSTVRLWSLDGRALRRFALTATPYLVMLLPDSNSMLTWVGDSIATLWSLDGDRRIELQHHASIEGIVPLPGGRRLLSWARDSTIRIWSINGVEEKQWRLKGAILGAAVLTDSQRLMTWSVDSVARFWSFGGAELAHFRSPEMIEIVRVVPLPDQKHLIGLAESGMIYVLSLEDAGVRRIEHYDPVKGLLLLPDGKHSLVWGENISTLRLVNLDTLQELSRLPTAGPVQGARMLPDGQHLLMWSADRIARLWQMPRGKEVVQFRHQNPVEGAALLPDGQRILTWSSDSTVYLWRIPSFDPVAIRHWSWPYQAYHMIQKANLLPGRRELCTVGSDKTIRLWTLDGREKSRIFTNNLFDKALLWPQHRQLLAWRAAHGFDRWSLDTEQLDHIEFPKWVNGMASDTKEAHFVSWCDDNTAQIWTREGVRLAEVGHTDYIRGATLLAAPDRLLTWSDDSTARLWSFTGDELRRFRHGGTVVGASVLSDGQRLMTWSHDRTVRLWSLDGRELMQFPCGDLPTVAMLLPDQQHVLTGAENGEILLWSLKGQKLGQFRHDQWVRGAVLLPDGQRLLTWSLDGTARVWTLAGRELVRFSHDGSTVSGTLLLPDGQRLLTWSDNGIARIWSLQGHELARLELSVQIRDVLLGEDGQLALVRTDHSVIFWPIEPARLLAAANCSNVADLDAQDKARYDLGPAIRPDLTCRPLYPSGFYANLADRQTQAEQYARWALLPDWDTTRLPIWSRYALAWFDSTFARVRPHENPAHWDDFDLACPGLFAVLDSLGAYAAGLDWVARAEALGTAIVQRDSSLPRIQQWWRLQRSKTRFLVLAGKGAQLDDATWQALRARFPDDIWLAEAFRRRGGARVKKE